jgi:replicative DNA helicase
MLYKNKDFHKKENQIQDYYITELIIAKQRNGPTRKCKIKI